MVLKTVEFSHVYHQNKLERNQFISLQTQVNRKMIFCLFFITLLKEVSVPWTSITQNKFGMTFKQPGHGIWAICMKISAENFSFTIVTSHTKQSQSNWYQITEFNGIYHHIINSWMHAKVSVFALFFFFFFFCFPKLYLWGSFKSCDGVRLCTD